MKTCVILILLSMASICVSAEEIAPQYAWNTGVFLSEVYCHPSNRYDPAWVEIAVKGTAPVDLSKWVLAGTPGMLYTFPTLGALPPGTIVLVYFHGSTGPAKNDTTFQDDGIIRLYVDDPAVSRSFRGNTGYCALFTSGDFTKYSLVDFVCWGKFTQNLITQCALDSGLWNAWRQPVAELEEDTRPSVLADHSYSRVRFTRPIARGEKWQYSPDGDWDLYKPNEISVGRCTDLFPAARPSPPAPSADFIAFSGFAPASIIALPWEEKGKIQFHIICATDEHLKNKVIDICVKDLPYRYTPPLPPGTYYLALRLESATATTHWSIPMLFQVQ